MTLPFHEIVSPEGTEHFVIQAYIQSNAIPESLIEAMSHCVTGSVEWFDLSEGENERGPLLIEITVESMDEFANSAINVLRVAKATGLARACVLMFDGVYDGANMLLSESLAVHTYGVATQQTDPVLCLDINLMLSDEWRNLIKQLKRQEEHAAQFPDSSLP